MKVISPEEVLKTLTYPKLIFALKEAYGSAFTMPPRKVFRLDEDGSTYDAFALLPSWNESVIAVKSFTYFPDNKDPFKTIYAKILLYDRKSGEPLALVDGTTCTLFRTAGISALASQLLSREDSETMLLLGTGNLAPYLVRAHASVRSLSRILIWGRAPSKAEDIINRLSSELPGVKLEVAESIESACAQADIIVSATGSHDILVYGDWVKAGTHTDFLGNHHADMRECDTDLVLKSKVYVDTYANCFNEAGEILIPINEGVFTKEDVRGELAELCAGNAPLRESDDEITFFKSVGSALSDLVAAFETYSALK